MTLSSRTRLAVAGFLAVAAGILISTIWATETAHAQTPPKRDTFSINIAKDAAGVCTYEIADYPDQLTFDITPGGFIDFQATNTAAQIEVMNDASGVPGVAGDRTIQVRDGAPQKRMVARGPRNQTTTHMIEIFCCDRGLFGLICTNKVRAVAPSGLGSLFDLPEPFGFLQDGTGGPRIGPSRIPGEPDDEPDRRDDGPTMRVDEGS